MPDGLDQMLAKVGSRKVRSPNVPITPSLHPKDTSGSSAPVPSSPSAPGDTTPPPRPALPIGKATFSPINDMPRTLIPTIGPSTYAARRGKIQLRSDQEGWLHGLIADALREGVRVSEGDVLRVAVDRLRAGRAGWSELRDAVLAETRSRARRRS